MEATKSNAQPPVLRYHFQIGDWVYERGISQKLSPPMYIMAILKDTLYLEIDPEQGDPFEIDIEDIEPIPLTKEMLVKNDIYGKRIVNEESFIEGVPGFVTKWDMNYWVDIHKYRDKFIAKYHGRDDEYLHVVYLRYVHELQHFYRMFEIDKTLML